MSEVARLEAAVIEVNRLSLRTGLKAVERLGRYLLDAFFEGDIEQFTRGHGEHATWRALARHPQLTPSASTLWFAVRTVEQLEQLPAGIGRNLTATHHRHLIPLDGPLRLELAEAAAHEGWTVHRLRAEIAERGDGTEPGVARSKAIGGLVRGAVKVAALPDAAFAELGDEDRARLREELEQALDKAEQLTARVAIALRGRMPERPEMA